MTEIKAFVDKLDFLQKKWVKIELGQYSARFSSYNPDVMKRLNSFIFEKSPYGREQTKVQNDTDSFSLDIESIQALVEKLKEYQNKP